MEITALLLSHKLTMVTKESVSIIKILLIEYEMPPVCD